ncbi:hypothetical protein CA267_001995 [Alteromonas pelagimontana]|uniref:Uncharacterized protein n=1 Tax=Alteromonas pelagimontana TaxID=1858656 RepID=A0A6M4MAQ9_9ALTE|nr:hypothetical protein [Alteromonas pelagimontana]QJR79655.1 hypothetical protein CA267_001995 [Alteromonas pelagimontana]
MIVEIFTKEQIEDVVSMRGGGWKARSNYRKKLKSDSNELVLLIISEINSEIRSCKASGLKEQDLRTLYGFKSRMERKLIYV